VGVNAGEEPDALSTVGDVPGAGVVQPATRQVRSSVNADTVQTSFVFGTGRQRRLAFWVLQLVSAASLLMAYR
jgi:hypothetical protein